MAEERFWIGVHGVITHAGRILILRRASSAVYKPGHWDLPGGHLAVGETVEQCLAREVAEETGLSIKPQRFLGFTQALDGPYVQIVFACAAAAEGPIQLEASEHDQARWLTRHELNSAIPLIPYLERIVSGDMLDSLL